MFELPKEIATYAYILKFALAIAIYFSLPKFLSFKPDMDKKTAQAGWLARMAYTYKAAPSSGKRDLWISVVSLIGIVALHILIK
ncbi:MAG: hypothetical protein A3J24_05465 [Deltaproteobacteria bacterium RIFCSPLOWO2_02_FULL_53_8]|nr:MAG: hypothetical protein A3J24_05465 [Deltaproteobacteria bacterium RIFCSPLOWO2_02_FULL_53_8]